MSLSQGFPNTFSNVQQTQEVLHNLDNETKKIYTDVNTLMAADGHAHTGNGNDGALVAIADNAVITAKIADGAVTADKLHDASVTLAKLDSSAVIPPGALVPIGSIVMFEGTFSGLNPVIGGVPNTNWVVHTPMTNRMPIAAGGSYAQGATGGETTHALTPAENGTHQHFSFNSDAVSGTYGSNLSNSNYPIRDALAGAAERYSIQGDGSVANVGLTSSSGSSQAHNNMPPYYGIYFIKRIS